MAAVPTTSANGPRTGSAASLNPSSASTMNWEGDRMFNIYIHDYCVKRGFSKTAKEFHSEAQLDDTPPPIDAGQGLLFEWWTVFWALFTAKNGGPGGQAQNEDALVYVEHQGRMMQRRHQLGIPPHLMVRNPLPNGMHPQQRLPSGPFPNGMPNGVTPGHPMMNGTNGFPIPQPNGAPQAGPSGPHPGGQPHPQLGAARPMSAMPGRPPMNGGPPFQTPAAAPSPGQAGQAGPRPPVPNPMPPPTMTHPHNGVAPEPPTPTSAQFANTQGGPSSRAPTPSNGHNHPHGAPTLGHGPPAIDMQNHQSNILNHDLSKIPAAMMNQLRHELGLSHKDLPSLTMEEKQKLIASWKQKSASVSLQPTAPARASGKANNANPGPSTMPPPSARNRGNKRASTSPGDDNEIKQESSPPSSKRQRRSPNNEPTQAPPSAQQHAQPPQPSPMMAHPGAQPGPHPTPHPGMQPGMHGQPAMSPFPGHHPMANNMMTRPPGAGFPQVAGLPHQMGPPGGGYPGQTMIPPNMMHLGGGAPHNMVQYRQAMATMQKSQVGQVGQSPSADGAIPQGPPYPGGGNLVPAQNRAQPMKNTGMGPPPPPSPAKAQTPKDAGSDTPSHVNASPRVTNSSTPGTVPGTATTSGATPSATNGPATPANVAPTPSPSINHARIPTPASSAPPVPTAVVPGLAPSAAPPQPSPSVPPAPLTAMSMLPFNTDDFLSDVSQQGIFGDSMGSMLENPDFNIDDWFVTDSMDQPTGLVE